MNKLALGAILWWVFALTAASGQDKKEAKAIDPNGEWKIESLIVRGEKVPVEAIERLKYSTVYKDGKCSETSVVGTESATYKIDASKSPATIDYTITEGQEKGKTQLGVIKIDGDLMTLALADYGDDKRPKGFDGKDALSVVTLKRSK
jgi:uncharacterized protein (TIGR03067 family)